MKYPNLAAEVEATGNSDGFGFNTLAHVSGITERLLRRIVWGDGEIMWGEGLSLYRALTPYGSYEHYSLEYLFSKVPAVVPPGTNKTIYRLYTLRLLLEEAERLSPPHWWTEPRERARRTLSAMERGKAITYAAYRLAVNIAKHIIADRTQAEQRQVRDVDEA